MSEKEHDQYKDIGGIDDSVKIILTKETLAMRNGTEMLINRFKFEAVE